MLSKVLLLSLDQNQGAPSFIQCFSIKSNQSLEPSFPGSDPTEPEPLELPETNQSRSVRSGPVVSVNPERCLSGSGRTTDSWSSPAL